MAIKNYMINDKWLDIAKQNIVEVESTDGVIGSVKVNGQEYGGGGGSSDFSTAKLTYIRTNVNSATLYAPVLQTTPMGVMLSPLVPSTAGTNEYDVVVYTNGALLSFSGSYTPEISGNIQEVAAGTYLITGDCTFKIEGIL